MIQEAAAVVIGSGSLGSSIAFHLAKAGLAPVALVDKNELASQTSPRAAGLTSVLRRSELMTRLATRAVEKIKNFSKETGGELIYFQSGSLRIARTAEHHRQLERDVELGRKVGIDIDFVTPAKAKELMPFLEPVGIHGVTFVRNDLYLEPVQVPRGYANAIARLQGVLLPKTNVTAVILEAGAVRKVITDRGEIRTPIVVDAAGAWARLVAGLVGARLGAIPTRHQLLITEPIPGVDALQPITRIIDCNVYIRPADGGLMLGGYESNPLQFDMATLPASFGIPDLPLDISVLHGLASQVQDQFPIFRNMKVKEHRGGLPTMTADAEHIVGPVPDVRGLYVASGCCVGGLTIAPAIGELLAEWIVSGEAPRDLSPLSPARSAVQSLSEDSLREACREQYAHQYWPKQ